jgi:hypothetical protein
MITDTHFTRISQDTAALQQSHQTNRPPIFGTVQSTRKKKIYKVTHSEPNPPSQASIPKSASLKGLVNFLNMDQNHVIKNRECVETQRLIRLLISPTVPNAF